MNAEPEIKEVDLIKVKVIKKKHVEGLREFRHKADFTKLEFLYYITEWDAILVKDLINGHIGIEQATNYYSSLQEEGKYPADWLEAHKKAQEFVHSLPQLFLD